MATSVPVFQGKARAVCWTLFDYDYSHVAKLRLYGENECTYMIFGYETCPTTGKPHLQGFTCWENPRSLQKFKDTISDKLHMEKMRGTHEQASNYCKYDDYPENKKENKFEEFGELPAQGARTDWRVALQQLKSGKEVDEVVENQPQLLPAIRSLQTFKSLTLKPLHRDVKVIVLWGAAGTGKTRWAYENYPDLYSKSRGEWWDGYTGQTAILLDDYYGYLPYSEMLRVLDRYPYHAQVKGGFVWAQWNTVIITSNKHPMFWYGQGMTPALERRLTEITELKSQE